MLTLRPGTKTRSALLSSFTQRSNFQSVYLCLTYSQDLLSCAHIRLYLATNLMCVAGSSLSLHMKCFLQLSDGRYSFQCNILLLRVSTGRLQCPTAC